MIKRLIPIFIIINILLMIYCAVNLILILKPSDTYENLEKLVEIQNPIIEIEKEVVEVVEDEIDLSNPDTTEPTIQEETVILEDYNKYYDWDTLVGINSDVRGWLYINEEISYPVVQKDNSYYLNHNFEKKWDSSGCLFFEQRVMDETQNKIIHGHNMEAKGTMFSSLKKYYSDTDYVQNNPYIYYTPVNDKTIRYELVAVMQPTITNIETVDYLKQDFVNKEDVLSWITTIKENSIYFNENASIDGSTEFLTLSTCDRTLYGRYGRFAVLFKISY